VACLKFLFDWLGSLTAQSLNPTANLPVIVFIHGGAFIFGSSNDAGPEYLLEGGLYL
jgi:carboxylesterase type B